MSEEKSSLEESESLITVLKREVQAVYDDQGWYEIYKSITNEKDMAEKDQQKLVRRERRMIQKKKKLREKRIRAIQQTLEIRKNFRRKNGIKQRSLSVDRYDEYTDKEYEQELIKQQIHLHNQLLVQH